jgi:stage V sporulation protein G
MEVTEVKVKLVDIKSERLKAFCTVTLDGEFVVRDIKIIEGGTGPFVAMPSRKLAVKCGRCSTKNHLRSKFCNECGASLPEARIPKDAAGRIKLHADVAHPINPDCRERIQSAVIEGYNEEIERSKEPGYIAAHAHEFDD